MGSFIWKIGLSADHAGFLTKELLKEYLIKSGYQIVDFGTSSQDSIDYPDVAHPLAVSIEEGRCRFGIALCGSGNGVNMSVNKHSGIRGALCWNEEIAKLARAHNDANILSLPARFITPQEAIRIVEVFLATDFEGGRHTNRINKIPCN